MNIPTKDQIRSRARGCFLGVAIGDAYGMPWESMKPEEIAAATESRGVLGFVDPHQTRVKDTAGLTAGSTTDDWQLTRVVAESLAATRGRFDLADCTARHLAAFASSEFGWGKTTRRAMEKLRDGHRHFSDPLTPPQPGQGCGNGIVMKVAPLAIVSALRGDSPGGPPASDPLLADCVALGGLTHPDLAASIAAYSVARLIRHMLLGAGEGDCWQVGHLRADIVWATVEAEIALGQGAVTSEALQKSWEVGWRAWNDAAIAAHRQYCGPESAAFTADLFFKSQLRVQPLLRFRWALAEAVNAGGDTDTNASIVSALLGAQLGEEKIPAEWRNFRPEFAEAANLADQLIDACA